MTIPKTTLVLLLAILPYPAHAKNIFVAQDGSGNYTRITAALTAAQAGDSIYVKPGEYKESLRIKKDNISLKGAGFSRTKLIAKEDFPVKAKGVKGFKLEGFFIKALTGQGHSAVLISDSDAIIRHCLITSNPDGYGIFCNKGAEVTIEHNTIVGNQRDGGIRLDSSCKLTIKNNIIVNNSFGINSKDMAGTTQISYNNVWGNGKNLVNCQLAEGNISADPQFVNPKAEDYHLSPSSPCLKAGKKGVDMGPRQRIRLPVAKKKTPAPAPPVTKPKPTPPQLEVSYELVGADQAGIVKASEGATLNIRIKNSGDEKAKGVRLNISSSSPSVTPISPDEFSVWHQEDKLVQVELSIDPQALTQEVELKLQISEQRGYSPASQSIRFQLISALTTGLLEVNSAPDQAEVYLDGVLKGKTPLTLTNLEPGRYKLGLKKASHGTEMEVQVEAGRKQSLTLQLRELFGRLQLGSQPEGANVYIDGKLMGETPLSIPDLSIGEHQLKLSKYIPQAILQYEAPVIINPDANQLEITKFEEITPPPDMIHVPAGGIEIGSQQGNNDQQPIHRVYLDDFYVDKDEVTNAKYQEFMQATGHKPPTLWGDERFNQPQQPVVGVSWQDATAYCQWLDKRLPTEVEWEKAARGATGYLYPWGDEFIYSQANVILPGDGYGYTAPVGNYPGGASPYGVLDMAGNVAEWCADWYAVDYYQHSPRTNPQGPASGEYRVVRGGSWNNPSYEVRSTYRWRYYPDTPRSYIGLRCVWQP